MYIQLMHRHYGLHEPIKHTEIPCNFGDVYISEDNINEDILLGNIGILKGIVCIMILVVCFVILVYETGKIYKKKIF